MVLLYNGLINKKAVHDKKAVTSQVKGVRQLWAPVVSDLSIIT